MAQNFHSNLVVALGMALDFLLPTLDSKQQASVCMSFVPRGASLFFVASLGSSSPRSLAWHFCFYSRVVWNKGRHIYTWDESACSLQVPSNYETKLRKNHFPSIEDKLKGFAHAADPLSRGR